MWHGRIGLLAGGWCALFAGLLAPIARSQCQTGDPCDVGRWSPTWDWNGKVCCSYACPNSVSMEFYHGALIPVGQHAGKVVLMRADIGDNCSSSNDQLETWIFDPASPATLIKVNYPVLPNSQEVECGGHTWDPEGRLVFAGGVGFGHIAKRTLRFDPLLLGTVQYPIPWPGLPPCAGPTIDAPGVWSDLDTLEGQRYYPTLITLLRWAIQGQGAGSAGLVSATAAIGGSHTRGGNFGSEIWELFGYGAAGWALPLVPDGFFNSTNFMIFHSTWIAQDTEQYVRKPDASKPSPLSDSYPRAFQVSTIGPQDPAKASVFIAGDTRTVADKPLDPAYGGTADGRQCLAMAIPYAQANPSLNNLELWDRNALTQEHDYGNPVILSLKTPGVLENRILVFGGRRWTPCGPTSCVAGVNDSVEEFDWAALGGLGVWLIKTPMASRRLYSNAVVLPDGTILIIGGTQDPETQQGSGTPDPDNPQFQPELYDPGTLPTDPGSTRLLAQSNPIPWPGITPDKPMPRLYHSMAMLLLDGRVLVCGGRVENDPASPEFPDSRLSGELFYPPYFFETGSTPAVRPAITSAPGSAPFSTLAQGIPFEVQATTFDGPPARVTLLRPASVTHHFDSDQRYIELTHVVTSGGPTGAQTLSVTAPRDDQGPSGYYMLFVLEQKPSGKLVPSVAKLIRFV